MVKRTLVALTVAALVTSSAPALADRGTQDLLEAMGRCAGVADDHARLACYDGLAPHVKEALAAPPSALPSNRPPTEDEQRSWFGFDLGNLFGSAPAQQTTPALFGSDRLPETKAPPGTDVATLDSISAGVTDVAYTPFGKFILFLDNGQVWRQIEADTDHALFRKPAKDNKVTISRGFVGSYNLTVNGGARVFKVSRLK